MSKKHIIIILFAITLFASCGEKQKAQSAIENFLKENLVYSEYDIEDFSGIDSTAYVTEKAVAEMRKSVYQLKEFKKNMRFSDVDADKKLLYMTVKYTTKGINGKEMKHKLTFYLNREDMQIVSFKNN